MTNKENIIKFSIEAAKTNQFEFYNRRTERSVNAKTCCYTYYYGKNMTHQAIADMFGVNRINVTQSLTRFSDRYKYLDSFRVAYDAFCTMVKSLEQ